MQAMDDMALLREYAGRNSEAAFAEPTIVEKSFRSCSSDWIETFGKCEKISVIYPLLIEKQVVEKVK
jgi:hypothetical protein